MTTALTPLQNIRLFASLSEATLAKIEQASVRRTFNPGEILLLEGEPGQAAYFILEGSVRVYRTSLDAREQVLALMEKGQSFNTVPVLQPEGVNHASVRAVTAGSMLCIRGEDFRRLLQACPDFSFAILQDFAARLADLTDLVEDLSLHSVRGRLARFLLDQADQGQLAPRWTQDEIASQLGTVRDMVGRTLRAFMDEGLIRKDRQRILLVDRDGLEAEANY